MAADDAVRFLADQLGCGKYLDKNGMDRTKLAVLEMLGAQEPTPRHLLRRLEKLRSIIQNHENPARVQVFAFDDPLGQGAGI